MDRVQGGLLGEFIELLKLNARPCIHFHRYKAVAIYPQILTGSYSLRTMMK